MATAAIEIPGLERLQQTAKSPHTITLRAERDGIPLGVRVWQSNGAADDATLRQRFQLDAFALARCETPNIPKVLSVSTTAELSYVVYEQHNGISLIEMLDKRYLTESETLKLGTSLAETLAALHRSGIIHGNVNANNIVVDETLSKIRLVNFSGIDGPEPRAANPNETIGYDEPIANVDEQQELVALGHVLRDCMEVPASGGFGHLLKRLCASNQPRGYTDAAALHGDLVQLKDADAQPVERADTLSTGQAEQLAPAPLPLAGRSEELQRLFAVQAKARSEGGQVALVEGASGVGKSRLAQVLLVSTLETGDPVLWAKCEQWDPSPFSAIQRLLDSYVARAQRQSEARHSECAAMLREVADDLAPLLKVLPGRIGEIFSDARDVPRTDDAEHVYVEGLGEFLARLCRQLGHCVLILDDIQWLDAGSRSVIRRYLGRIGETNACLLMLTRPGYDELPGVSDFRRTLTSTAADELILKPLDPRGREALIRSYLSPGTVDEEDVIALGALSDGTPLATLELLRTLLESTVLALDWGRWRLDITLLRTLSLPSSALDVLRHRVLELDAGTRSLLATGAVIGAHFDGSLLAELEPGHREHQVERALHAGLIVNQAGRYAFVHDAVQEALLGTLTDAQLRQLHQRIAETLDRRGRSSSLPASELYALADHFAQGHTDQHALMVYESSLAAGKRAFEQFDNARTLTYLVRAREVAQHEGLGLDANLLGMLGEAFLRKGDADESLELLSAAYDESQSTLERAGFAARAAWVAFLRLDPERANSWQKAAFAELAAAHPTASLSSVANTMLLWGKRWARRRQPPVPAERKRLAILCELYYQQFRLAAENDRHPLVTLQSLLAGLHYAEQIGDSSELSRALASYSFVWAASGRADRMEHFLARAEQVAQTINDPVARRICKQLRCVMVAWSGDMHESIRLGRELLEEDGHWLELAEFSAVAHTVVDVLGLQGRDADAWEFSSWLLTRFARFGETVRLPAPICETIQASASCVARLEEADAILGKAKLNLLTITPKSMRYFIGYSAKFRLILSSPIVRQESLDKVLEELDGAHLDPARIHLGMATLYATRADLEINRCFESGPIPLPFAVKRLTKAARDLKKAARIPLLLAHSLATDAYVAYFTGKCKQAEELFEKAEALGKKEKAPAIDYAVYRGRAHLVRKTGTKVESNAWARRALMVAEANGSVYRQRWIKKEFDLDT